MSSIDLTHHFLIAMPNMADPYFAKTLTYICEHNDQGALGLVVNRPIDMTLQALFERLSLTLRDNERADAPVYFGGPVQTDRGFVLHSPAGNWQSTLRVGTHIGLTTSKDILEAARMDGATITKELIFVLTPMALPGIASTLLLNVILAWNEAFWTLNLSTSAAAPLTTFIASYSSPEGLFWAKLSAASTLAIAPILVLGWFSQKQLVRGLTFGAVK